MTGRPKKKPEYDGKRVLTEYIDNIAKEYETYINKGIDSSKALRIIAKGHYISRLKTRKLLITAGVFHTEISDKVNRLYDAGCSVTEIQAITGLKKSSINGYLPYDKALYNAKEKSAGADRISHYRYRQKLIRNLKEEKSEEAL